jgi:hypothetical protein
MRRGFLAAGLAVAAGVGAVAADLPGVWTTVNDNDPAASYSAGVDAREAGGYYEDDFHCAQKPGDWASFTFIGTGVKWIGARNVDHAGDVDVFIDGKHQATIKTDALSWLKQQELYAKVGLPYGPHTLKIVVRTGGYQDFDAFACLAPPLRAAALPKIEGVTLPPQLPYLNVPHRYPVGNGVAVIVGGPTGQIERAFGPGYTSSDLINSEDLLIEVDGVELPLSVPMKRAAGTGVFYGLATRGDLDLGVVDYTCRGQPWISRLLVLKNSSATAEHTVVVRDGIAPHTENGYSHRLAVDAQGNRCGFVIQGDTSTGVPFGGNNTSDKVAVIAFNGPAGTAYVDGQGGVIATPPLRLAPHAQREVTLTHYFRAGQDMTDAACLDAIRRLDSHAELRKSIGDWQSWIDGVAPAWSLSRIRDDRARELVEGALVILKNNQSQDGGIIAHTTFYKEGYVRDAAMAIRGLLATGHTDEAKKWLSWIDRKLSIHGHLGDAMNCEVSLDEKSNTFDMGNMDVEEPGWVLLCARDYYRQTHDLDFLKSIDRTLRFCADIQLKDAAANGDKLEFNGDETEICGAVDVHPTGVSPNGDATKNDWALSSVAMAAASVQFYSDYVKACGGNPSSYHNAQTNTTMDLNAEVAGLVAAMDRDFWRTDLPESPAGFHDFFRAKADGAWPKARDVNFTLMPVYFGTPYAADEQAKDVAAIAQLFDLKTGFLQLVPGANNGMEGHDLGYLLDGCVETGDWHKEQVYSALVNGPTVDCWGSFNEAYDSEGHPNDHDLRSLETGINVSALAKYWGLGSAVR